MYDGPISSRLTGRMCAWPRMLEGEVPSGAPRGRAEALSMMILVILLVLLIYIYSY